MGEKDMNRNFTEVYVGGKRAHKQMFDRTHFQENANLSLQTYQND